MIVFDSNFLMLAMRPNIPASVDKAKQRVTNLVEELQKSGERIVVPTPVLTEFLIHAGTAASTYLEELQKSSKFRIAPFGTRASMELAAVIRAAVKKKNKKDGSKETWAKVNFDRQIAAIGKVENAHTIYTDDSNLKLFAEKLSLKVMRLEDVPVPESKTPLLDILDEKEGETDGQPREEIKSETPRIQGSDHSGSTGQTAREAKVRKEKEKPTKEGGLVEGGS